MTDTKDLDTQIDELKAKIQSMPLCRSRTVEDIFSFAIDKSEDKETVLRRLNYAASEFCIAETFTVGGIQISRLGDWSDDEFGKYEMSQTDTGRPVGGREHHGTREEIIALAQKYDHINTKRSEDVDVVFPTGELIFANYFSPMDELPEDIQWNEEFSINEAIGRENTMKWLAENRGIAYGQLGNTSCAVYKVNDDKIYITSAYYGEEDGEIAPPGELMGTISCGVWRFEAVDKARFAEHGFKLKTLQTGEDRVKVKVNPGEWSMRVYYQHRSDEEQIENHWFPLWAELTRKSEANE